MLLREAHFRTGGEKGKRQCRNNLDNYERRRILPRLFDIPKVVASPIQYPKQERLKQGDPEPLRTKAMAALT